MSLSCTCDFNGDGWWYIPPDNYSELKTKKRQRCCSCKELIDKSALCGVFERYRLAKTDIEINIYGEEGDVRLANRYMCETCLDLYYSLDALGFCIYLNGDSMQSLVKEYAEAYE